MATQSKTGKVKFFNAQKGYGFIIADSSNEEMFVHSSGLIDHIKENDKVKYDIADGKKGPQCVNVAKV